MAPTPEQKNEQVDVIDQVQKNTNKLDSIKDTRVLWQKLDAKITTPEAKDMKDPWENVFDKDGKYKQEYLNFVNTIADRPKVLQDVITIGKEKWFAYVTDKTSFIKFATDNNRGNLHDYLKDKFPDMDGTVKNWQDVEKPTDIDKLLENNKVANDLVKGKVENLWTMNMALYDNIKMNSTIFFDLLASGKNIQDTVQIMTNDPKLWLTKLWWIVSDYTSFREKNQYQKLIDTKIQENFRSPAIWLTQMADKQKEA